MNAFVFYVMLVINC